MTSPDQQSAQSAHPVQFKAGDQPPSPKDNDISEEGSLAGDFSPELSELEYFERDIKYVSDRSQAALTAASGLQGTRVKELKEQLSKAKGSFTALKDQRSLFDGNFEKGAGPTFYYDLQNTAENVLSVCSRLEKAVQEESMLGFGDGSEGTVKPDDKSQG